MFEKLKTYGSRIAAFCFGLLLVGNGMVAQAAETTKQAAEEDHTVAVIVMFVCVIILIICGILAIIKHNKKKK